MPFKNKETKPNKMILIFFTIVTSFPYYISILLGSSIYFLVCVQMFYFPYL